MVSVQAAEHGDNDERGNDQNSNDRNGASKCRAAKSKDPSGQVMPPVGTREQGRRICRSV
jgi:hypothetical protein